MDRKIPEHVVVEKTATGAVWSQAGLGDIALCSGLCRHPPPPLGASWQQSLGYEARPQSLVVVWNSFFSLVKKGKGNGCRVPLGSGGGMQTAPAGRRWGIGGKSWSFPQFFSLQGTARLAAEEGRGGVGPGERCGGRGYGGAHSNMQSPAAP